MRRTDGELILFWSLPVMAVLWISAFFLFPGFAHPMSPTMSAQQVADFYRDPGNLTRIRYSMIMFNWFGICLIPVVMLLVIQMRKMAHRTPIYSYCMLACAAGGPAIFLCANLFWLLAAFRPDRPAELTQLFNDLAWVTFTVQVPYLIMQSLLLALAIYTDHQPRPVFSTWVAHFNVVIAIALAPATFTGLALTGAMAWNGLFPFWVKNIAIAVWIVVMGVVIGRQVYQRRAEETGAEDPVTDQHVSDEVTA